MFESADKKRENIPFCCYFTDFEQVLLSGLTLQIGNCDPVDKNLFKVRKITLEQKDEWPLLESYFADVEQVFVPIGKWNLQPAIPCSKSEK